jgi:hypothetical protein
MLRTLALAVLLLATPASASAEELNHEQAMKRMEACLSSGAPSAPRESLTAAAIQLRALCKPQIDRVRDLRLAGVEDAAARDAIIRRLNDEVAFAIANYTGLSL